MVSTCEFHIVVASARSRANAPYFSHKTATRVQSAKGIRTRVLASGRGFVFSKGPAAIVVSRMDRPERIGVWCANGRVVGAMSSHPTLDSRSVVLHNGGVMEEPWQR